MTVRTAPSGKHSHPLPGRMFLLLIALCLAGLVMGLAAIRPILTAVLHPGEYTATVTLNWGLSLPESGGCVYEADSGSSLLDMTVQNLALTARRRPQRRLPPRQDTRP